MHELQFIFKSILNDAPQPWQLGFQDSASPSFSGLVELHNKISFFLIVISLSVFWVLFALNYYYKSNNNPIAYKYLTHGLKAKSSNNTKYKNNHKYTRFLSVAMPKGMHSSRRKQERGKPF